MRVCCVFDRALNAYMSPIFVQASPVAARSFADEFKRQESAFAGHPEDFDLYELGTFDGDSGRFVNHDTPVLILRGKDAASMVAASAA